MIVLIILGIVLVIVRRNRRREIEAWRRTTKTVVRSAMLAADLIPAASGSELDVEHWDAVKAQAKVAIESLEICALKAPSPDAAEVTRQAAECLQAALFAVESDRLLRDGTQPPTAEQLVTADQAIGTSMLTLHDSLDRLDRMVEPEAGVTRDPRTP